MGTNRMKLASLLPRAALPVLLALVSALGVAGCGPGPYLLSLFAVEKSTSSAPPPPSATVAPIEETRDALAGTSYVAGDVPVSVRVFGQASGEVGVELLRIDADGAVLPATLSGETPGPGANVAPVVPSPEGTPLALVWDSFADSVGRTAPQDGVRLAVRPARGIAAETNAFRVDNTSPPRVVGLELEPLGGALARRAGIEVRHTVEDAEGQRARVELQFSTDGGASFRPATLDLALSSPTADLTTDPPAERLLVWDSVSDAVTVGANVLVRVVAADTRADLGRAATSEPFAVDNTPPDVNVSVPIASFLSDVVPVGIAIVDANPDPTNRVDLEVSFSTDGGATFQACREATGLPGSSGTAALPTSTDGSLGLTFLWNAFADVGAAEVADCVVAVTPIERSTGFRGAGGIEGFAVRTTPFVYDGRLGATVAETPSGTSAVAIGPDGAIYASDTSGNRILRVDPLTRAVTTVTAEVVGPEGLACGPDGTLYVGDSGHYRILAVETDGQVATVVSGAAVSLESRALAADPRGGPEGLLYVAIPGEKGLVFGVPLTTRDLVIDPEQMDPSFVFIAEGEGGGDSGDGGPAAEARLSSPEGLAVDDQGDLLISDSQSGRIRIVRRSDGPRLLGLDDPLGLLDAAALTVTACPASLPGGGRLHVAVSPGDGGTVAVTVGAVLTPAEIESDGSGAPVDHNNDGLANWRFTDDFRLAYADGEGKVYVSLFLDLSQAAAIQVRVYSSPTLDPADLVGVGQISGPAGDVMVVLGSDPAENDTSPILIVRVQYQRDQLGIPVNAVQVLASGSGPWPSRDPVDVPVAGPDFEAVVGVRRASFTGGEAILLALPGLGIGTLAGTAFPELAPAGAPFFVVDGFSASRALFLRPRGLAVGPGGTVAVADGGHRRVRTFTPGGVIHTAAGSGSVNPFQFLAGLVNDDSLSEDDLRAISIVVGDDPTPDWDLTDDPTVPWNILAVDPTGDFEIGVWVSDTRRLLRVVRAAEILEGRGVQFSPGLFEDLSSPGPDGLPPNASDLGIPVGVAIDGAGNIYTADREDGRIRRFPKYP